MLLVSPAFKSNQYFNSRSQLPSLLLLSLKVFPLLSQLALLWEPTVWPRKTLSSDLFPLLRPLDAHLLSALTKPEL